MATTIGYQASSLKDYLSTKEDIKTTFQKLHTAGYRHVQLQWIDPAIPADYTAAMLKEAGLTCIATQDDYDEVTKDLNRFIGLNKAWGSNHFCIGIIPLEFMEDLDGLKKYCAEMTKINERMRAEGITLSVHPIWLNFDPVGGTPAMDIVMDLLPDDVKMTLCFYHAIRAGLNPVETLNKFKSRIVITHYKDYDVAPGKTFGDDFLVPVGNGKIDWPPIFAACNAANIPWGLAEQETFQPGEDPFESAKKAYDYMLANGLQAP